MFFENNFSATRITSVESLHRQLEQRFKWLLLREGNSELGLSGLVRKPHSSPFASSFIILCHRWKGNECGFVTSPLNPSSELPSRSQSFRYLSICSSSPHIMVLILKSTSSDKQKIWKPLYRSTVTCHTYPQNDTKLFGSLRLCPTLIYNVAI